MIKKSLILAGILIFASSTMSFASDATTSERLKPTCNCAQQNLKCPKTCQGHDYAKRHAEFEKRLKLTEEQKAKAEMIRNNARAELAPLIRQIKDKKQEMEAVKLSRMAVRMQEERLAELGKELKELKAKAHEIRMQNMKEFEAILTKKQLKELKKMKSEGRKKYQKLHKNNANNGLNQNCKRCVKLTPYQGK